MATNPQAVAKALLRAQAASPSAGAGGFGGTPATITNGISPLVASYDQWTNGRPAGPGLPREFSQFLAGSFGPLQPITPVPVDVPPPGEERAEPRRWQYQVGWNMPIGQPGNEGLKLASFANLRTVADAYSVARACIQVRSQEILGLGWEIGPTKEAEKKMRGDHKARQDFDERRAAMKKFWRRPDHNYFSFSSWLNAVLEDILAVDALSLYLHPSRRPGKGILGSDLAALAVLDGTTIRPLLDVQGAKPIPPNPAYQQYLYGVPRSDLMTVLRGEDVEDMGEARVAEYRGDQLLYLPYIARDWTPYGFPPIERALVPIMSGLQRQQYQLSYFDEGSIPGMFISAGDPNTTPNQLRELQDALNAMAGDPAWKHRIIVLPGGSKVDPIRPVPLADQFDEIIMTQVCMSFDVMPMELGISPKVSTTQSPGAANQMAKASQNIHQRKATKPLLKWLAEVFDTIIQDVVGQTDMCWKWEGLEEGEDETALSNRLVVEIGHGLKSIDEGRLALGEQPWGLPLTSDPVYFTATGVVPVNAPAAAIEAPPGIGAETAKPSADHGIPAAPAPQPAAETPAHAGAEAHADTIQEEIGDGTADAADTAKAEKIDTFAALRELDLIRRRVTKGRTLDDWEPEHIPADVFTQLASGIAADAEGAITHARTVIKNRGRGVRRAHSIAVAQDDIATGLRRATEALAAGTLSPAKFVDETTQVMRAGILTALHAGATDALTDLGHVTKAGKPPPKRLADQYAPRIQLYAGQATAAYEQAYGLTTTASRSGMWLATWQTTSGNPCDLCADRDGQTFAFDELPGFPAEGGFGDLATVCRGGSNCHCIIIYTEAEDDDIQSTPTAARTALAATYPQLVDGASGTAEDPDAYDAFLGALADRLASQQRTYLEGLLQALLATQVLNAALNPVPVEVDRPAGGDVSKHDHRHQGLGGDDTHEVYAYLARHYPAGVLEWVKDARWEGPATVRLADIDMARRPGGARNPAKVEGIADAVRAGQSMAPIVLVETPDGLPYKIADGWHRTEAFEHLGRTTVQAWIGHVDSDDGQWGAAMNRAKLNKADQKVSKESVRYRAANQIRLDLRRAHA